jgi:hypothetical protein
MARDRHLRGAVAVIHKQLRDTVICRMLLATAASSDAGNPTVREITEGLGSRAQAGLSQQGRRSRHTRLVGHGCAHRTSV